MTEVWHTEQWEASLADWRTAGRSATQPAAQSYAKHLCDKHQVMTRVTNPEGVEVCRYRAGQARTPGPAWFLGQS